MRSSPLHGWFEIHSGGRSLDRCSFGIEWVRRPGR